MIENLSDPAEPWRLAVTSQGVFGLRSCKVTVANYCYGGGRECVVDNKFTTFKIT